MQVLILGSGVIGTSVAYYLARAGHEVTVLERQPAPALETSFGNAGEVSPGYSAPWAGPGVPVKAIKWMLMQHSPLVVKPMLDPAMWRWGLSMLRNCTQARYELNKGRMVRLAEYSRDCLKALRADTGIQYDERMQGTLQLFRTQQQLDGTAKDVEVLKASGVPYQVLDRDGCLPYEPALAAVKEKFVGGLRLPGDETGDCFKFTQALAKLAEAAGVTFKFGVNIQAIEHDAAKGVTAVRTDQGSFTADRYVVALGSYSPALGQAAGHRPAGVPGQGLLDHRADHRRGRRARIHRDGRDLQGGRHPPGRPHPRGRHGTALGLRPRAESAPARHARTRRDRSLSQGAATCATPPSGRACAR
jgi:D-amino-acid dehydrogenase